MNLRRLLLVTSGLTVLTMVMGVYTAEFGAGLACEARWPLCDGAVYGLFPANIPSFVEWFHRLLAMVTGFVILGTAVVAWRRDADEIVKGGLALALVMLPIQIILGALTVTRYEVAILTAHFGTPTLILGGVTAAAVWSHRDVIGPTIPRLRRYLSVVVLGFPVLVVFTPRLVFVYSWIAQMSYYILGLSIAGVLLSVALLARDTPGTDSIFALESLLGAVIVVVALILGRLHFGDVGQLGIIGLTIVAVGLVLAAIRRLYRLERSGLVTSPG
ncbi:MAG: COX15/CtaA family protein [Natronomonas sp.]